MLMLLDRNELPVGYLTKAKNAQRRRRLNGEMLLSFEMPLVDDETDWLEHDAFVVLDGQKYLIKDIDPADDGRLIYNVKCVHVYIEAVDDYIDRTVDLLGVSCLQAATEAVQGTEFTIGGGASVTGLHDINLTEINVLKALQNIREKWNCDLWFNNRSVYLGTQGIDRGAEIRYGKNLKSLQRPSSITDVITRLYVYGKDGLTIEAINGGMKYIDSPNIELYRKPKVGTVRFNDIDDANELLSEGVKYLQKNDFVRVSYQVDFLDLCKLGYDDEEIDLGDTVTLTHLPFNFQTLGARAVEIVDYPLEKRTSSVTLSSFIETTIDDIVSIKRRQGTFESYSVRRHKELKQQADELGEAQTDLESYVDTSFRDGVITESEAKAIGEHKRQLAKEKADVDAEYTKVHDNAYLPAGTVKTDLQTAKTNYDASYSALVALIDTIIADSTITDQERTDVDVKFSDLTAKLAALRTALENAWDEITKTAEGNAIGYADTTYSGTKQAVENGDLFVKDKYGQVIVNDEGLDLTNVAGFGVESGGIISLQNRVENKEFGLITIARSYTDLSGVMTLDSTVSLPPSNPTKNLYFMHFGTGQTVQYQRSDGLIGSSGSGTYWVTWSGKTDTTLTGCHWGLAGNVSDNHVSINQYAGQAVFKWKEPVADVVISPMTVVTPGRKRFVIPETRFNAQTLGASYIDVDGWQFRYLYVSNAGVVQMVAAGTSGGLDEYPPNPPSGSVRLGYMLVGYGKEDPDGSVNITKDYATADGYPFFKEKIYHDIRYRDERTIRSENNDLLLGGTPYGVQTLAVSANAGEYKTYYIQVGKGRRSVNLSLTLDDGSGYDNYSYGAQLTVGRKAANNADGKGRPLWATYVDADGNKGHVAGQRNTSPYGIHVLSPRVWNKTYTMLYDADLMPDPSDPSVISIKLTFYNYSGSTSESFSLRANWHAL